eukprot:2223199-Rhodomonas_salina.1
MARTKTAATRSSPAVSSRTCCCYLGVSRQTWGFGQDTASPRALQSSSMWATLSQLCETPVSQARESANT